MRSLPSQLGLQELGTDKLVIYQPKAVAELPKRLIEIYNLHGEQLCTLTLPESLYVSVMPLDNNRLLVKTDDELQVWHIDATVPTKQVAVALPVETAVTICGKYVIGTTKGESWIWDTTATGSKTVRLLPVCGFYYSLSACLIGSIQNKVLTVYDVRNCQTQCRIQLPDGCQDVLRLTDEHVGLVRFVRNNICDMLNIGIYLTTTGKFIGEHPLGITRASLHLFSRETPKAFDMGLNIGSDGKIFCYELDIENESMASSIGVWTFPTLAPADIKKVPASAAAVKGI